MDSAAIAYWLRPEFGVTIDYGQHPAAAEIRAAISICDDLNIQHHIIRADLSALGSGDMAGKTPLEVAPVPEWWPFRNQMLITLAAMKMISLGADRLLIGCLRSDGAHADGRKNFISAMDDLLRLQEGQIRLEAPAIELDAINLVRTSGIPFELLAYAHSCHVGNYACGLCRGCRKHYETMQGLGVEPY
jgi:7-cyano-7-deazaguanine synthase